MALTTAAHHSSEKVAADVKDAGLRAQTMVSTGQRPGVLTEPEPQGGAVTVGYVAAPGPLLVVASLAGGDEVDATTVSHLLKAEEERKVQERKERVMRDIHRKIHANEAVSEAEWAAWRAWHGISSSSSGGQKRKRKKRRKRRTPRTSSLPGRARRRQRQWSACYAGFTGYDAPRVMFPFSVARPKMLRVLAVMDQKDRCSGIYMAGIAGDNAPRAVFSRHLGRYGPKGFSSSSTCLSCSRGRSSWSRRDVMVQTVQNPVEFTQVQFLDKVMLFFTLAPLRQMPFSSCSSQWRCRSCSSSSRSSTSPSVRRDSFPWSHYSETIEFLLLQYNDKVDDVGCARRAGSHGCRRGGDSRALVEKFIERELMGCLFLRALHTGAGPGGVHRARPP